MKPKGRDAAFQAFFATEALSLQRFATFMCGDSDLGADLTQEAFVRVYKRWLLIRSDEAPAYVRRTIVNLVKDRHRKALVGAARLTAQVTSSSEPARTGRVDDWIYLTGVLRRLPPMRRAAVVLRFYEDMSERQIAETLNRPLGTVKSDLHRALKELRHLMDPQEVAMKESG